jgi:predicted ABC-type exoprotein transport system permease subunit
MELDDFKNTWQANGDKKVLDFTVRTAQLTTERQQNLPAKYKKQLYQRYFILALHSIALVFLFWFLVNNINETHVALSTALLIALFIALVWFVVMQIGLIKSLDFNKEMASVQSDIIKIRTHSLNFARLSVLAIPIFLSFPVVYSELVKDQNFDIFGKLDIMKASNGQWPLVQVIACVVLLPLGFWFYHQISYKNIHKNWVKRFVSRFTGTHTSKALETMAEIEKMKR